MSNDFDKRFPKLPSRKNLKPEDRAVISKLVPERNTGKSLVGKNRELNVPDFAVLGRIANRTASNVSDAKNMFQILPDMDLARQILISAILSPTDLTSSKLLYSIEGADLDSNLTGPMLRLVKEYFTSVYRINRLLPEILDDALFMKGSYPMLILPESSIDHAINSSHRVGLESVKDVVDSTGWYRPLGLLGPSELPSGRMIGTALEGLGGDVSFGANVSQNDYTTTVSQIPFSTKRTKFNINSKFMVTDNPDILKNPLLVDRLRQQRVKDVYGNRYRSASMEAKQKTGPSTPKVKKGEREPLDSIQRQFYTQRQYQQVPLVPILTPNQLDKGNVGHPMVMHLPTESVIPVHVPGNPRQHVGYFVLLDVNGNPIALSQRDDFYADIRSSMASNPDMASHLLQMTRRGTYGRDDWNSVEINEMANNYGQIVEKDLLNRLRNGVLSGDYEFSRSEEINRLMFSRAMSQKNTLMLYVPVELMTYVAFDYNEYGVGKSLLEDGKILASLRAVLMFAGTMAAVKNATGTQTINIQLSPDDEDPYSTVEFMLNQYAKLNREGFPIGDTHPADLINHLQNAGKNVVVTGNTAFPEVRFDVQTREGSHKEVNPELDESLRRRHIQMFGLTPENMEAASGADFATQVVNNFLMLQKRVIQYQGDFKPFMEDFHRSYILNSGALMDELREIVEKGKRFLPKDLKSKGNEDAVDDFIHLFVNALQVDLPAPETNRLTEQMQAFDAYTESVKKALDAYFSEEMLDSTNAMTLFESVPTTKAALLSHFQRKFLRENNILPELDIFNTMDEEENPTLNLLEEIDNYTEGLLASVEDYMKKVHTASLARKKRLDKEQQRTAQLDGGGLDDGGYDNGFDDTEGETLGGEEGLDGDDLDGETTVEEPIDGLEEEIPDEELDAEEETGAEEEPAPEEEAPAEEEVVDEEEEEDPSKP